MTDKNLTDITILIDASGSMTSMVQTLHESMKKFYEDQRKWLSENPSKRMSLSMYEFSSMPNQPVLRPIVEWTDLSDTKLRFDKYKPDGWTPLLDATSDLIDRVGDRYLGLNESERPGKVLFAIMTDGMENASIRNNWMSVKQKIEHQTARYNWAFIFLGANIDSFTVGYQMGISVGNISNYHGTTRGTSAAFAAVGTATQAYSAGCDASTIMSSNVGTEVKEDLDFIIKNQKK